MLAYRLQTTVKIPRFRHASFGNIVSAAAGKSSANTSTLASLGPKNGGLNWIG